MTNTCPETLDLLDHLEKRGPDLSGHLASCGPCRDALADLRGVLAAEAAAAPAPSPLETERALASVMGRARQAERRRWGATAFFSAAAAVALALLIPAGLVGESHAPGGGSSPGGLGAPMTPSVAIETSFRPNTTGLSARGQEFVDRALGGENTGGISSLAIVQSQNATLLGK
jgi:hypothetical protein